MERRKEYVKSILMIYIIATVLYMPLMIKNTIFAIGLSGRSIVSLLRLLLLGYHLWYLSSLLIGLLIWCVVSKAMVHVSASTTILVITLLLSFGILFDEYYKLLNISFLNRLVQLLIYAGGSRTWFLSLSMLLIGRIIAEKKINLHGNKSKIVAGILLIVILFLPFAECYLLSNIIESNTLDVSIFGWMPAVIIFLFGISIRVNIRPTKSRIIRKIADVVYIVHPWFIAILGALGVLYLPRFCLTTSLSLILGYFAVAVLLRMKKARATR